MFFEPAHVKTYRRIRREFAEVISPIIRHATREEMFRVGDLLGLVKDGVFLFDEGGVETQVMQDYLTYEIVLNDPRRVEKIVGSLPEPRRHYITETKEAPYSVYKITRVDARERVVTVADTLRGDERHEFVDLCLSQTLPGKEDLLFGWRLVRLEGIELTTGSMVPIPADSLPQIRSALERRMREGLPFKAAMARIWPTTFRKRDRAGIYAEIRGPGD